MNLKSISVLMIFLVVSARVSAQHDLEKMEKENVVAGSVTKKGKTTEGYIKRKYDVSSNGRAFHAGWDYQSNIKFISKEDFDKLEKIKGKHFEKYQPKDIDGYIYDTLIYETVKYSDMSAVGMGMIPKKMFMRKVDKGSISLFHFFSSPPAIASGPEGFAPYYEASSTPQIVYRKGNDGKLKLVNNMNIKNELAECTMVQEKHSSGVYNNDDDPEKSGLAKLANNTLLREQTRLLAIKDFNENCK